MSSASHRSPSTKVSTAPRRSTSLTMNRRLLEEARELGVNVSRAAEDGVARAIRAARAQRWREENAGAIDDYNHFIDTHGIPLSEFRKF
jgi:antitoxin CcdA